MAKIQRLDAHLTNMIAAGEVVERPMGIVKECIENSIDAHATQIEVHILEGGLSKITIVDNGDGMDADDTKLAFERHATSKIKKDQDLFNIQTLGFRGEAIPSIASVSEVDLQTNNGQESTKISVHYGNQVAFQPYPTSKGTQIDISNLFQRTPARFKHLKTTQYEFSLISDVVQKFSLAYPTISFILTHNSSEVYRTKGNGNLQEVIMQIYGREIAKSAISVDAKDDDYNLSGYIVQPSFNRATKYYIYIFMNNRMIRSMRLSKAVMDAYSAYMPHDRYPIVVLNIQMDPQLIDVNVHPSKWEVRLAKEKQCEQLIFNTITKALQNALQIQSVQKVEKVVIEAPTFDFKEKEVVQLHHEIDQIKETTPIFQVQEEVEHYQTIEKTELPIITEEPKAVNPSFPELTVIGQFHNCYILAQAENGLYIIDQHAAQERYHYEQVSQNIFRECTKQTLLVPLIIQVTPAVVVQLKDINEHLATMHIQLELFGEKSLLLREVPLWLKQAQAQSFIEDMLDLFIQNQEVDALKLRKSALASIACHSSIRFNRSLSMLEMKQVIEDLKKCEQPFHCPHGRPTLICISDSQLEKDFYREG